MSTKKAGKNNELTDQQFKEELRGLLNLHVLLFRYKRLVDTASYLLQQLNDEETRQGINYKIFASSWTRMRITSPYAEDYPGRPVC